MPDNMTRTSELSNLDTSSAPVKADSSVALDPRVPNTSLAESISPESQEVATTEANAAAAILVAANAAERKKLKSRAANRAAVELLCVTYPQTFSFAQPRPLKIGIQEDLVADGKLSQTKIKRGLASYVRAFGYLKSQTDAAPRINLLGEAEGAVKADEAAHALTKLPAPRKPSKPRPSAQKRPVQARNKAKQASAPVSPKPESKIEAKIEKAPSAYDGLNEGQRIASKLELLLSKNK